MNKLKEELIRALAVYPRCLSDIDGLSDEASKVCLKWIEKAFTDGQYSISREGDPDQTLEQWLKENGLIENK